MFSYIPTTLTPPGHVGSFATFTRRVHRMELCCCALGCRHTFHNASNLARCQSRQPSILKKYFRRDRIVNCCVELVLLAVPKAFLRADVLRPISFEYFASQAQTKPKILQESLLIRCPATIEGKLVLIEIVAGNS